MNDSGDKQQLNKILSSLERELVGVNSQEAQQLFLRYQEGDLEAEVTLKKYIAQCAYKSMAKLFYSNDIYRKSQNALTDFCHALITRLYNELNGYNPEKATIHGWVAFLAQKVAYTLLQKDAVVRIPKETYGVLRKAAEELRKKDSEIDKREMKILLKEQFDIKVDPETIEQFLYGMDEFSVEKGHDASNESDVDISVYDEFLNQLRYSKTEPDDPTIRNQVNRVKFNELGTKILQKLPRLFSNFDFDSIRNVNNPAHLEALRNVATILHPVAYRYAKTFENQYDNFNLSISDLQMLIINDFGDEPTHGNLRVNKNRLIKTHTTLVAHLSEDVYGAFHKKWRKLNSELSSLDSYLSECLLNKNFFNNEELEKLTLNDIFKNNSPYAEALMASTSFVEGLIPNKYLRRSNTTGVPLLGQKLYDLLKKNRIQLEKQIAKFSNYISADQPERIDIVKSDYEYFLRQA